MPADTVYLLLADAVLVTHLTIVAFVVLGLVLVVAGNVAHWRWVNRLWLRLAHLGAIAVVILEAWAGFTCPLTTLEMWLRLKAHAPAYAGGFVEHWLQELLYYEAPAWVFVLGYTLFGVLVLATWWRWPPMSLRPRERSR
ncbi:MAG TPA: DUF2784 domain-containing protein [Noviherbaspirillum sp.]|uniref:DUF2784 domain-containing protein n=1 Tax=Noviherbaspirillum sp. TaxID=1926288 RepID=UPI002B463118|nr:DUF2784 domain-containing protein [Noviherbaspirillum sp.]HJV84412.1 DUF2784 domain-containing protein [Noviherbaspirillum sp.]